LKKEEGRAPKQPQSECFRISTIISNFYNGAFTLDVKSVLNENLGGIVDGTQTNVKWALAYC
jgi:hypothetical protein